MDESSRPSPDSLTLPAGWKVLLLANGFTTVPEPSGGTRHFIELAGHWQGAGQALCLMTQQVGVENCRLEGYDGPFLVAGGRWTDRLPVPLMYAMRSLVCALRLQWQTRNVCLYGTSDMLPDVLPAFLYRLLRPGSSFWVNCVFHLVPPPARRAGPRLANRLSYAGQRLSLFLVRRAADMVVVDNELLRGQLVAMGFCPSRVYVTPMGADVPAEAASERDGPDGCYVGRLHPSKGIFDLVDVWKRVEGELPGSRLVIAGAGPERLMEELRSAVAEAGLGDRVELPGHVSREELERLLGGCKVFVFPSHEEGFGIGILEAMAFGAPVAAFELPHYRHVFGEAMARAPLGDTGALAETVTGLLNDEERRREMGRLGRKLASGFSWPVVSSAEARVVAGAVRARFGEAGPVRICCPSCLEGGTEVTLGDLRELSAAPDGTLECPGCGERYPVIGGIPVMLTSGARDKREPHGASEEHEAYETGATKRIARLVGKLSGPLSLDVGCGKGPYSGFFSGDLVLVDINPDFLREAMGRRERNGRVMGVVADAAMLPFATGSFDFVLCSSMLEHLPPGDVGRAVASLRGLARGTLLVDVPNENGLVVRLRRALHERGVFDDTRYEDEVLDHHVFFSPRSLRAHGFTVRGCIGWTSRETLRLGPLWDLYDLLVYRLPRLADTLVGFHGKKRKGASD